MPIRRASAIARLGIRPASGFLIYGPPGVGKSLLVKAAATDAGARLIALSAPDLLARLPGEGEKLLRDTFASARNSAPTVIFIDELDLLAPVRAAGGGDGQRNERVVMTLLAEMDRVAGTPGVFVIGSTSRPNVIDPSLLRPGRLDELVYVGVPDAAGRARLLVLQTDGIPLAKDVDLAAIGERCERFTAADIEDLARRAGMAALARKADAKSVTMADFEAALDETRASVTELMEKDYEKVHGEIKQNALNFAAMGFLGAGQLKPVRVSKHGPGERG